MSNFLSNATPIAAGANPEFSVAPTYGPNNPKSFPLYREYFHPSAYGTPALYSGALPYANAASNADYSGSSIADSTFANYPAYSSSMVPDSTSYFSPSEAEAYALSHAVPFDYGAAVGDNYDAGSPELSYGNSPDSNDICRAMADSSGSPSSDGRPEKSPRDDAVLAKQRHMANMRERRRMGSINTAFETLRHKIPTFPYEKKLSKVDTLKMAIRYIRYLHELVTEPNLEGLETGGSLSSRLRGNGSTVLGRNAKLLRKVIINYPKGSLEDELFGSLPQQLALSWAHEGVDKQETSTKSAKIWVPAKVDGAANTQLPDVKSERS